MIIIIDNYDSFTYNLYQQIQTLGAKTIILLNDKTSISEIQQLSPQKIVISPGPKSPKHSGISTKVIQSFHSKIPILGVCLGHQCIAEAFGSKTVPAKEILHGKTSAIHHSNEGIFKNIGNPFQAARYHSLAIDKVPPQFQLTAWTKDQEIMAIQHQDLPLFGIQFHPESFMTSQGEQIIRNFLHAN